MNCFVNIFWFQRGWEGSQGFPSFLFENGWKTCWKNKVKPFLWLFLMYILWPSSLIVYCIRLNSVVAGDKTCWVGEWEAYTGPTQIPSQGGEGLSLWLLTLSCIFKTSMGGFFPTRELRNVMKWGGFLTWSGGPFYWWFIGGGGKGCSFFLLSPSKRMSAPPLPSFLFVFPTLPTPATAAMLPLPLCPHLLLKKSFSSAAGRLHWSMCYRCLSFG